MDPQLRLIPESASTVSGKVDAITGFAVLLSIFFSVLIATLVIVFAVRYRRRHENEIGTGIHGSNLLEIVWSAIPLGIVLFLFGWGTLVFFELYRIPAGAVEYWAVGKQWMWKFQHPTGQREINQLHVPAGTKIRLTMTSEDVIHSFFVPAFRIKQDVVPGRYTTVWFEATTPGTYHLFCTEYCGVEHSKMIGQVVVMQPADYQAWLARGGATKTPVASGEELFAAKSCNTCHRPDSDARAPILVGAFGKSVRLQGGASVTVDDNYVRESILNPQAKIVEGFQPIMPTFQGQLSEEELAQLIAYVKTMGKKPDETAAAASAAAAPADARGEAK